MITPERWTGHEARLLRTALRLSVRGFAAHLGVAERTISKWERAGRSTTPRPACQAILDTALARASNATHARFAELVRISLSFPQSLDSARVAVNERPTGNPDESEDSIVQRRQFLQLSLASSAATLTPAGAVSITPDTDFIRLATISYRKLDATTNSAGLLEPVRGHLALACDTAVRVGNDSSESAIAHATASEAAGLAGWLAADVDDMGMARRYYSLAIHHARQAGDATLVAYMIGSLAQFAVEAGEPFQGVTLISAIRPATAQTGQVTAVTAMAWMAAVEAVARATAGDPEALGLVDHAERMLDEAERLPSEPKWPWLFPFDRTKAAMFRAVAAARLGRAEAAQRAFAAGAGSTQSPKQLALLLVDHARVFLAKRDIAGAASMARGALELGLRYGSLRARRKVAALRREFSSTQCVEVQALDELLAAEYRSTSRS
jgi:transcriptional regulator with XRE-family HTH domain